MPYFPPFGALQVPFSTAGVQSYSVPNGYKIIGCWIRPGSGGGGGGGSGATLAHTYRGGGGGGGGRAGGSASLTYISFQPTSGSISINVGAGGAGGVGAIAGVMTATNGEIGGPSIITDVATSRVLVRAANDHSSAAAFCGSRAISQIGSISGGGPTGISNAQTGYSWGSPWLYSMNDGGTGGNSSSGAAGSAGGNQSSGTLFSHFRPASYIPDTVGGAGAAAAATFGGGGGGAAGANAMPGDEVETILGPIPPSTGAGSGRGGDGGAGGAGNSGGTGFAGTPGGAGMDGTMGRGGGGGGAGGGGGCGMGSSPGTGGAGGAGGKGSDGAVILVLMRG